MSFRPPRLDDRSYDDLVAELLARIPAHTPEWTNPRPGDPGRTLIELFSWLGDALLYRANLIPERQRLAFLRLLGSPLRPARAARGLVTLSLRDTAPPVALQVRPVATLSGPVPFEARDEFTVLPVTTAVFYKRKALANEVPAEIEQALSEFHAGGGPINTYFSTPVFSGGAALPGGLDIVADTADRCLWLALLAQPARPASGQAARNEQVRQALGGHYLNVGFTPAMVKESPLRNTPPEPVTARSRVPHAWEITVNTTGQPVNETSPWRPEYLPLDEASDTTVGLTQPGVMRLVLPRNEIIHAPANDVRLDVESGVGDRPPRIDDPALASRLVAWLRLRPAPALPDAPAPETQFNTGQGAASLQSSQTGATARPREVEHLCVAWTGVNAIEVEQHVTQTNLIVGESTGAADQEFQLPAMSIEPETLAIEVEEEGRWIPWQRIDDLMSVDVYGEGDASLSTARDARVFQLDPLTGTVLFGDGMRGRVPPAASRIRVRQMRFGGGLAGNLPAGALKAITARTITGDLVGDRLVVAQTMPLEGGLDPESLAEAERRIPARLQHRDRAVTAEDYSILARETPGVSVGRVELLPRFKPQQRDKEIPGIVTVMVLPDRPVAPAPNPRADRPLLEAVHSWLDARRPLATELYVIGCEYVPVAASVMVTLAQGAQPDTTLQAIKEALRRFLWPLTGGGFDRQGWPLGRPLSNRELAVEVARVEGVSEVAGLNLFERAVTNGPWVLVGDSRTGREQNIALERWQLPELLVVVAETDDTATGAALSIPGGTSTASGTGTDSSSGSGSGKNPFADPRAVPLAVPVVPETC